MVIDDEAARRLTEAARHGDQRGFTELLRVNDERMWALAWTVLQDRDAMDDALQVAYLEAYRGIGRFGGRSSFSTWLHAIVYRTCIDELRRRRPTEPIDELPEPATGSDVGDRIGQRLSIDDARAR